MEDLHPRKQLILKAVILEYVHGAEPVASELITVKYNLGVKSATVRNELAEMSELGYLEQPHTSAGRIPSDKGYRYYVDHLSVIQDPATAVRQRVKDAASGEGETLQLLLQETTRSLSRLTHLLSVATTVRSGTVTVKSALVSAFGPQQALVVLGLSNGEVQNRIIECPANLTLHDVGVVNDLLMREAVGKTVRQLQKLKPAAQASGGSLDALWSATWNALRTLARDVTRGTITTEGEEFLFAQPEFAREAGTLSELLDQLKQSDVLYESITTPSELPSPVTIGKENKRQEMHKLSVVRQSFFVGQDEAGTIAVVGPTRMDYDLSIPLVQLTARALSDALTRYAGER
jgi:heat-inducible transcriptional repressor